MQQNLETRISELEHNIKNNLTTTNIMRESIEKLEIKVRMLVMSLLIVSLFTLFM